jgi:hypothetical protein
MGRNGCEPDPGRVSGELLDFRAGVVRVSGRLEVEELEKLERELLRLLRFGCTQLIVDLEGATNVTGEALAPLESIRDFKLRRGALALVTSDPMLAGALGGRGFFVDAAVEDALDRFAIRADDR